MNRYYVYGTGKNLYTQWGCILATTYLEAVEKNYFPNDDTWISPI
jgi:hypothetical protein